MFSEKFVNISENKNCVWSQIIITQFQFALYSTVRIFLLGDGERDKIPVLNFLLQKYAVKMQHY